MKIAILSMMFLYLASSSTADAGLQEQCLNSCRTIWAQKYHDCKQVKECEAWAVREFANCLSNCKNER